MDSRILWLFARNIEMLFNIVNKFLINQLSIENKILQIYTINVLLWFLVQIEIYWI
jgi:hypothetical protein